MGKISQTAIVLILVVIMLLPTTAVLAVQDKETKRDTVLASESVVDYIEGINDGNDDDFSAWVGAYPVLEYTCFNLNKQVNAYVFTVKNDQATVGHVIIGGASYNFDVFKASIEDPPSIPAVSTVVSSYERDIEPSEQIGITEEDIADPEYILFLGIRELYAVYKIKNRLIGINLENMHAVPQSDMTTYLPSPEKYKTNKEKTSESINAIMAVSGSGEETLILYPYYEGNACGPNAGVAIIRYYRQKLGFSMLPSDAGDMYDELYDCMDTWPFEITVYIYVLGVPIPVYTYTAGHVTEPWDFGPGIAEMMRNHGYWWKSDFLFYDEHADGGNYDDIVYYIDRGWPGAVCCWGGGQPWQWHWYAIKGYRYEGSLHEIKTVKDGLLNWDSLPYWFHTLVIP